MSEVEWVVDQDEFEELLNNGKVVVDFTAPGWCVPCKQFAPHFEKAAEKSDAKFVAVDVDLAPWAVVSYGVLGVPTVQLYQDGEHVRNLKERTVIKLLQEIES